MAVTATLTISERHLVLRAAADRPGTPPGVGMGQSPQRYLHVGEVLTLRIAGLDGQ